MENQDNYSNTHSEKDTEWERSVLEKLAFAAVTEQRRVGVDHAEVDGVGAAVSGLLE